MRACFLIARHNFDKELRNSKRKYALNKAHELAYTKNTNMTCFWKSIKQLRIRKQENIPMAVYEEGHLNNLDRIVERWIMDYKSLYNTEHICDNSYIRDYILNELKTDDKEENICSMSHLALI